MPNSTLGAPDRLTAPSAPNPDVYAEFAQDLAALRDKYRGRPRREVIRLFLLALEREQIVTVAYREELMVRRLDALDIDPEAREVIRHALLWAWKDEEIHAIYIRGALLRIGSLPLKLVSFVQQAAGFVAGWASSVTQHLPVRTAPFSRTLAALLTFAGWLLGKVPAAVRKEMRYHAFREFCEFNVDAERTAALCWRRLVEIVRDQPDLRGVEAEDFARMEQDEENHARIFRILADALDGADRLRPGATAEALAEQIRAVGEPFLARARRSALAAASPLGRGGRVVVVAGRAEDDKIARFRQALDDAGLPALLAARAEALGDGAAGLSVAIKATFMLGYHRKDPSPVVDPALVRELARYLRERGCARIAVVESPNLYDRFFDGRSVHEVARYFDLASPDFEIVDVTGDQAAHAFHRGMGQRTVARTWKDADLRITFGKLRSHPVEGAHLAVANLEGLGARCEEFVFLDRQAHRDDAIMTLADAFPPHFAILEGWDAAPDGLLGVLGCPRPRAARRIYAGEDALAVDVVAARHLGLPDPRASAILRAACHWFGDPSDRTEIHGPDAPVPGWRGPHHSDWSALLSFLAYPVFMLASGRGALFVPEMDEAAFPPKERPGAPLRAARAAIRAFLGLRHPRGAARPALPA